MNEKSGMGGHIRLAKQEFILDKAVYFEDKKDLYLEIKYKISEHLPVDVSKVRICGSAYWGESFVKGEPFNPGVSDLDAAIINPILFCRCMSEVREVTKNFSDQTAFPKTKKRLSSYEEFLAYSFKKGMIRADLLPNVKTKRDLTHASDLVSKTFIDHFEKVSFVIYDSIQSFAIKQASAAGKFRR